MSEQNRSLNAINWLSLNRERDEAATKAEAIYKAHKEDAEGGHGSLADAIIQAYETRLNTDPEAVKGSIQDNLARLSPEDAEKLLKELLEDRKE